MIHLNRLEEAQLVLEQAVRVRPHFARAHYSLGNLLETKGRCEAAIEYFASAAHLASIGQDVLNNIDDPDFEGSARNKEGLPSMPRLPHYHDYGEEGQHSEYQYILSLGNAHMKKGNIALSTKVFEKAVGVKPLSSVGWISLGRSVAEKFFH